MSVRITFTDKQRTWDCENPEKCGICRDPIGSLFVDGKTNLKNTWALMCVTCHAACGCGLGTGRGQMYALNPADDTFRKIWG